MPAPPHITLVCRDCGTSNHRPHDDLKPGRLVICETCGLVMDGAQLQRAADITARLRSSFSPGAHPPVEPQPGSLGPARGRAPPKGTRRTR